MFGSSNATDFIKVDGWLENRKGKKLPGQEMKLSEVKDIKRKRQSGLIA